MKIHEMHPRPVMLIFEDLQQFLSNFFENHVFVLHKNKIWYGYEAIKQLTPSVVVSSIE
jgi:hypothetical protein